MARTTEKVGAAAGTMRPYVERAITDDELRDNVRTAFVAARHIYGELLGGDRGVARVASKVASDEDIQEHLRKAISELREAADRLQGKEDHHGRGGGLIFLGIVLGVLFNPFTGSSTRGWLKSKVSGGSSSDFSYQGTNGAP